LNDCQGNWQCSKAAASAHPSSLASVCNQSKAVWNCGCLQYQRFFGCLCCCFSCTTSLCGTVDVLP
ncbi:unnamed protein product, partial [Musa hybrid cultivar]